LNSTSIPRTIPRQTIKVIGAWSEAAAHSILATESVAGAIPSRCEAETGGVAAAICEPAASLPLALSGTAGGCWRRGRGG
jgi:hypothetical protein